MPSGKFVDLLTPPGQLGPGARLVSHFSGTGYGNALYRRGDKQPLVTLSIDKICTSAGVFSRDGSRPAWGNQDGTVTVCDLEEIQKRLAGLGLGW